MQTPLTLPADAKLTLQYRVRHPSRTTTREFWTINARVAEGRRTATLGDFGRWAIADKAAAEAALIQARLDLRTRAITAFQAFDHLVEAIYTPTLSDRILADAYDAAQAALGNDKRAHRRNA
jgi:hypothetical protein